MGLGTPGVLRDLSAPSARSCKALQKIFLEPPDAVVVRKVATLGGDMLSAQVVINLVAVADEPDGDRDVRPITFRGRRLDLAFIENPGSLPRLTIEQLEGAAATAARTSWTSGCGHVLITEDVATNWEVNNTCPRVLTPVNTAEGDARGEVGRVYNTAVNTLPSDRGYSGVSRPETVTT